MTRTTTGSGLALESGHFESPPMHLPNGRGGAFRTDLVISRDADSTEKLIWWHEDDPKETPHNHPWDFVSTILEGGYTDHRYIVGPDGRVKHKTVKHRAGGVNNVPHHVFHNVRDVLPGTRTRMVCGEAAPGNEWGYLDIETGEYKPFDDPEFATDPSFIDQIRDLNPHMRPKEQAND